MFRHENTGKFYQTSRSYGLSNLLDLLLKRYASIDFVMNMDAVHGYELIVRAIENSQKENLFTQWLHDPARYEHSFDDYIKGSKPYRKSTTEEKEDILKRFGGD